MVHKAVRLALNIADLAGARFGNVPHPGRRSGHQNQEHPRLACMLRQMLLGDLVFLLARRTIDHRDPVGFGPPTQPPAETARHAHQMLVIQSFIGTVQESPPMPKPARSHTER